jgi:hypothetical protein
MKNLTVLLLVLFVLAGCAKKADSKLKPEAKKRTVVYYILTTRDGNTHEIQNYLNLGKEFTLRIDRGNVAETAPLHADFSDLKKLEVLEIYDRETQQKKIREAINSAEKAEKAQKTEKDSLPEKRNEGWQLRQLRIYSAYPEGMKIRVTYDDGHILEGVVETNVESLKPISGVTKHTTLTVAFLNVSSIEKKVEEVDNE